MTTFYLYSKYGDWCPPAHVKPLETPGELLSTWIHYNDVLIISIFAFGDFVV
jgi:alpha-L-rhamnosidase